MRRGTILLCAALAMAALLVSSSPSSAQPCTVTRDQLAADVNSGMSPDEINAKYANCVAADQTASGTTASASQGSISSDPAAAGTIIPSPLPPFSFPSTMIVNNNVGSVFYEEQKACGYHPQREELDCTVQIKQRFGFSGFPAIGAGSNEFILFCVDYGDGLGLVPVHTNGVHVHDEQFGVQPSWYFGVVVQSNPRLLALINNGRTLNARSILSWNVPPAACNTRPIWGNWLDFRIRLDP